ncbi:6-phosphogluconolactonase [Chitinophaga sedimenti]|uniref:6-phosphogluconolactonase n=1 Tax=Chitinophaga sedimenti TaxID=2033606 RepID=UPI00249F8239|nr:6-phosphogluconolactonase [Chitinophaga sedimenti]
MIPWNRVHFFWGDERAVPFTDDRNNAKMACDTLLYKVGVPEDNIHVMRTDIEPEAAAKEYELVLQQFFKRNEKALTWCCSAWATTVIPYRCSLAQKWCTRKKHG